MYEDVVALTQGNGRVESKRARRGVVGVCSSVGPPHVCKSALSTALVFLQYLEILDTY